VSAPDTSPAAASVAQRCVRIDCVVAAGSPLRYGSPASDADAAAHGCSRFASVA